MEHQWRQVCPMMRPEDPCLWLATPNRKCYTKLSCTSHHHVFSIAKQFIFQMIQSLPKEWNLELWSLQDLIHVCITFTDLDIYLLSHKWFFRCSSLSISILRPNISNQTTTQLCLCDHNRDVKQVSSSMCSIYTVCVLC